MDLCPIAAGGGFFKASETMVRAVLLDRIDGLIRVREIPYERFLARLDGVVRGRGQ
ncbi:MAG: hypothetical protein JXR96_01350 [Deltaproteobacteria bacterium]|nr:hypothetical protein [Deltaproteobacteria bacterium]